MIGKFYLTLVVTISPGQSGPVSNDNESVFHIPKAPELKPHHQIVSSHTKVQSLHFTTQAYKMKAKDEEGNSLQTL